MTSEVDASVVISTRNRAAYLPACLAALAGQTTQATYEVVIIDNGSTDSTGAVLEEWCGRDPRFRSAREDRVGLSQGKNAGIRVARGRLLLFTDDDTIPVSTWIEAYRAFFGRHAEGHAIAGGPVEPVPDDLGDWPRWFTVSALPDLAMLDHQVERPLGKAEYVWGGNMAVPAALFRAVGAWDETVGRRADERGTYEDAEFEDRLRLSGGAVWFCPAAMVRHRVDRRTITPRRVASTAFDRGRNEFWAQAIPRYGDEAAVPRRLLAPAVLRLAGHLIAWSLWGAMFRLTWSPAAFERTRHAAWSSGWRLDTMRAGRASRPSYHRIGRLAFAIRRQCLRLIPNRPDR